MIQKFRKKPVVIDVFFPNDESVPHQLENFTKSLGDNFNEWFEFIDQGPDGASLRVKTLEGTSYSIDPELDVIIRGVNGEYYPCKKDIFYKTYEPA